MKKMILFLMLLVSAAHAADTLTSGGTINGPLVLKDSNNYGWVGTILREPPNFSDLTLTSVSGFTWAYVRLTCTVQPCAITIQNTSNLTLYWAQTSTTITPTTLGFQQPPGQLPLSIPVVPGQNFFQWTYSTTGANTPAQAHW